MEKLINETIGILSRRFSSRIEEILSNCQSPIESLMLIYLVKELLLRNDSDLEFEMDYDIYFTDESSFGKTMTKIIEKKFNFPHCGPVIPDNYRYKAFKIAPHLVFDYGKLLDNGEISYKYNQEYEENIIVEPQFFFTEDGSNFYFLDIAVYKQIFLKKDKKFLLVNKIAIECDGHDFHSSKEQIMKDNQRTRILTKNGWSVIRYSGSEIYQDSKNELKGILDEIIQIFKKNGV